MVVDKWEPDPQILEVVNRELDRVRQEVEAQDAPENKYAVYENEAPVEGGTRFRFDMEFSDDFLAEVATDDEDVKNLLFDQVALDLADVLENGDTSDLRNPLLGGMDGKKVLGKELESVTLNSLRLYKEYKPLKESVEYTFFLTIVPVWS